jgi:diguanylate cyclase (GGDEF)-like protein
MPRLTAQKRWARTAWLWLKQGRTAEIHPWTGVGRKNVSQQRSGIHHTTELDNPFQQPIVELTKRNKTLEDEITRRRQAETALRDDLDQLKGQVEDLRTQLQKANQQLILEKTRLQQYSYFRKQLGDMTNLLEASSSLQEAGEIIALNFSVLFPMLNGALYLFKLPDEVELVAVWGKNQELFPKGFAKEDCWALRRGKAYQVSANSPNPACHHTRDLECARITCIPLSAQSEHIGILNFCELQNTGESLLDDEWDVLGTIADSIALALANIRMRESLHAQSIRDSLTALYNRRYLDETLPREIHRAGRHNQPISVLILDIDNFKRINDTFGHDAGDIVLKRLANLMLSAIRNNDVACRYGGEEFIIILPNAAIDTAVERAEQLRESMSKLAITHNGQQLGMMTVSIGVSTFPNHGASRDELIMKADMALYSAKSGGKNQVVVSQ